jgi:ATPase subunit of ABC transporter with duplicated ATPase domains
MDIINYYNPDDIKYITNNVVKYINNLEKHNSSKYLYVYGENGIGKTTIFKLCNGEIVPTNGSIISDQRVKIAYYNQQVID